MDTTVAPQLERLGEEERRLLLWLARESIRSRLEGTAPPMLATVTPSLAAPAAAFVTVYAELQLRGCVGTLSAEGPLHDTVVRLARSAAFDDTRFAPLAAAELVALAIEISLLSPLVPTTVNEIELGIHGVCLDYRGSRAVFLPKVAVEHGWDHSMLLSALCRKAMLPLDAWQWPEAELRSFTAEVFSDSALHSG